MALLIAPCSENDSEVVESPDQQLVSRDADRADTDEGKKYEGPIAGDEREQLRHKSIPSG